MPFEVLGILTIVTSPIYSTSFSSLCHTHTSSFSPLLFSSSFPLLLHSFPHCLFLPLLILYRFIHHFTRFQAHGDSGALEIKMHRYRNVKRNLAIKVDERLTDNRMSNICNNVNSRISLTGPPGQWVEQELAWLGLASL